jgi:hypothetical protein
VREPRQAALKEHGIDSGGNRFVEMDGEVLFDEFDGVEPAFIRLERLDEGGDVADVAAVDAADDEVAQALVST